MEYLFEAYCWASYLSPTYEERARSCRSAALRRDSRSGDRSCRSAALRRDPRLVQPCRLGQVHITGKINRFR